MSDINQLKDDLQNLVAMADMMEQLYELLDHCKREVALCAEAMRDLAGVDGAQEEINLYAASGRAYADVVGRLIPALNGPTR